MTEKVENKNYTVLTECKLIINEFGNGFVNKNDKIIYIKKKDLNNAFHNEIVDIEFTDKRVKPWKTDLWDNNAWMRGILINDPVSLEHLRESVCPQGEAELKAFLTKLKEEEWL